MPARASSLDNSVRARARLYCSKNPARWNALRGATSQSPPVGVGSEAAMTGTRIIETAALNVGWVRTAMSSLDIAVRPDRTPVWAFLSKLGPLFPRSLNFQ